MRNILLLVAVCCLLSACIVKDMANSIGIKPSPSTPNAPARDGEGKEVKIWVPKNMIRLSAWPFQARGEEDRCTQGYYLGKNVADLLPTQRGIYKILPNYGNRIWAYYYYYGEDIPGIDTTDWYITVFNIYADKNGRIYGCAWAKFPSEYRLEHGTSDGIRP